MYKKLDKDTQDKSHNRNSLLSSTKKRVRTTHPFVSETLEGAVWFHWVMAACVLCAAIVAMVGYFLVAVGILACADLVATTWRLVAGVDSPWKVRSPQFDCIVGYALAIALVSLCVSLYYF